MVPFRTAFPSAKIVSLDDGTLLMAVYHLPVEHILASRFSQTAARTVCCYLIRSVDDGLTWGDPSLLGVNMNETALLVLPDGDLLAVMRDQTDQALHGTRSSDGGCTWSAAIPAATGR